MKSNNTLAAFHILSADENGKLELNKKQAYHWHIPKDLRHNPINKGDIVLVPALNTTRAVVVADVFREDIEETGIRYRPVKKILYKAK